MELSGSGARFSSPSRARTLRSGLSIYQLHVAHTARWLVVPDVVPTLARSNTTKSSSGGTTRYSSNPPSVKAYSKRFALLLRNSHNLIRIAASGYSGRRRTRPSSSIGSGLMHSPGRSRRRDAHSVFGRRALAYRCEDFTNGAKVGAGVLVRLHQVAVKVVAH